MEAATDEQRMRLQISVDITAELLQVTLLGNFHCFIGPSAGLLIVYSYE